jgi:hypothetical protein
VTVSFRPHPGYRCGVIAIGSLLLIVLVGLIITRMATAALVATGMAQESARFQARSAFTGAGFTTTEAEAVVNHPVRRRVAMFLMLAGNAGIATVAASLLLGLSGADTAAAGRRVGVLVAGLVVIFFMARSSWADRAMRRLFGRLLSRVSDIEVRDYAELLHVGGDYVVDELPVCANAWMEGHRLSDLRLRETGVVVLGVDRDGEYLGTPSLGSRVASGDVLVVYGHRDAIRSLDDRSSPPEARDQNSLS